MSTNKKPFALGSVSEGTLRNQDLLPAFLDALEEHDKATADKIESDVPETAWSDDNDPFWESEECGWIIEELFDQLNNHCPPYVTFGAHPGNGSCFGFWPDIDGLAEDEDDVLNVEEFPDNVPDGVDYVAIVTDHGNVTLYDRNRTELWSCV